MRLSYKLSLGVALASALTLGVDSYIEVERSLHAYESDLVNHTARQAHALSISVAQLGASFGDAGAMEALDAANRAFSDVRARWFSLRSLLNSTPELTQAELAGLQLGRPIARLVKAPGSEAVAIAYSPVVIGPTFHGVVQVSQVAVRRAELLSWYARRAAVTFGGLLGIAWLCAWVLGERWVGRPVAQLADKAARMGRGDFGGPLLLSTPDEFSLLADTMNQTCEQLATSRDRLQSETLARLEATAQARRADQLATVGKLAAGLAHEVGTPIHVVSERAKMARAGEVDPGDLPRTFDIIIEQAARIEATIRQVLNLARQQPPNRMRVNLRDLLDATREILAPLAAKKSITIWVEAPMSADAFIDPNQIRQVLINLVMNAIAAMQRPGEIRVLAEHRPHALPGTGAALRDCWMIAVSDQGAGIAPEHMERIFEPFFTTKDLGEGTGLGLSIVQGIVREHGGALEVRSEPGQGATFSVYLPAEVSS
jgi:two-component system, NtrC family, sensor kinase